MPASPPHDPAHSMPQPLWFSIGMVAQITGISEATLRIWERRYHFPLPARSSGGHRLYGQDIVMQLEWVRVRLDEGMRVHRAIQALAQWTRPGAAQNDHEHTIERAINAAFVPPLPSPQAPDCALLSAQGALLEAVLRYDSVEAAAILDEAAGRHPLARVVLDVVGPTLAALGEGWSAGQIVVATEHFASNLLRHRLLEWMRVSPMPFQVRPIVLACAPEELHEGGLLMLGVLLRQLRWPVVYLGQSLPLSDLVTLVDHVKPALMVFVAMSETTALALAEWPHWLPKAVEPVGTEWPVIGYGGRPFTQNPALAEAVPGKLLGMTLYEGSQRIHRLMLNLNVLAQ